MNKNIVTDDVCFLCKDGGDLIECDHVYRGSMKRKRCQRVYHGYCLSFAVDDNSKHWTCPRHFCDGCGSKKLEVVCKYCPMSMCEPCVQKNEKTVRIVKENCHQLFHFQIYCILISYKTYLTYVLIFHSTE